MTLLKSLLLLSLIMLPQLMLPFVTSCDRMAAHLVSPDSGPSCDMSGDWRITWLWDPGCSSEITSAHWLLTKVTMVNEVSFYEVETDFPALHVGGSLDGETCSAMFTADTMGYPDAGSVGDRYEFTIHRTDLVLAGNCTLQTPSCTGTCTLAGEVK